MTHPYPRGAYAIAQARAHGKRPAGPLLVALNGDFPGCGNAVVSAQPGAKYRWDWVSGLPSVVVLIGKKTRLGTILGDIEACSPVELDVIDTDRALGWKVLFTTPKLRTVRWPRHTVVDWLGDNALHKKLNEAKADLGMEIA